MLQQAKEHLIEQASLIKNKNNPCGDSLSAGFSVNLFYTLKMPGHALVFKDFYTCT